MSRFFKNLQRKEFGYLLLVLVCIAGSLFAIFTFLATTEFDEATGVILFLVTAGLLVAGYWVGLMIVAVVGITAIAKPVGNRTEHRAAGQSS
jgi:LytS/YehU family sensor histidine kinase